MSRVRLDLLMGRMVHDANGRSVGRLEEIRVRPRGEELEVVEYHIGRGALMERIGVSLRRFLGLPVPEPQRLPWHMLDISDVEHPVLLEERS